MTEPANEAAKTAQDPKGEPREAVSVGQLNELTAKRQRMLLAGIATVKRRAIERASLKCRSRTA